MFLDDMIVFMFVNDQQPVITMKIVFITVFIPLLWRKSLLSLACDLRLVWRANFYLFLGIFGYYIGFKSIFKWNWKCGLRRSYCLKVSYFLKSDCWWTTWIWRKSWEPRGCSCCKSCQQQFPPHLFSYDSPKIIRQWVKNTGNGNL